MEEDGDDDFIFVREEYKFPGGKTEKRKIRLYGEIEDPICMAVN
jgi:hypothetical protein